MIYYYVNNDELLSDSDTHEWVKNQIRNHSVTVTVDIGYQDYTFEKWIDLDELIDDLDEEGIIDEIIDDNFSLYSTCDMDNVLDTLDSFDNSEIFLCLWDDGIKECCETIFKGINYIEKGESCIDRIIDFIEFALVHNYISNELYEKLIKELNERKATE